MSYNQAKKIYNTIFGEAEIYYSCDKDEQNCKPRLSSLLNKNDICQCGSKIYNQYGQPYTKLIVYDIQKFVQMLYNDRDFAIKMKYYMKPYKGFANTSYDVLDAQAFIQFLKHVDPLRLYPRNVYCLANVDGYVT